MVVVVGEVNQIQMIKLSTSQEFIVKMNIVVKSVIDTVTYIVEEK